MKQTKARDDSGILWRAISLRKAVEELQKAVKLRDISRDAKCLDEKTRKACRAEMRHRALNSRKCYAGGMIYAN